LELPYKEKKGGGLELELHAFEQDLKLYKEAYATYEPLGWYSTGDKPMPGDDAIHALITKYNERPLYLLLSQNSTINDRDLPITIYEQQVHVVQGQARTGFIPCAYTVTSDEAERCTLVHCAKALNDEGDGSAITPHFASLSKAVQQLNARVRVLHQFLSDHKAGRIQADQATLRQIKGLCNRLPVMDSREFQSDFMAEYNDMLLVTYLASMTKGHGQIAATLEKFNQTYTGQRGRGGRMGGMGGGMMDPRMMERMIMAEWGGRGW
jgi:COP9 signalosome complex subunit 6